MTNSSLKTKAESYLNHLCFAIPTRRVGTAGNQAANAFLAKTFASFGFQAESQPFECIDWAQDGASLSLNGEQFLVLVGPFSPGCRVEAPLAVVSKVEELELADIQDKILLLRGEIAREQLMPKNFPFYNPDEHQRIIHLLETKRPAAILSATGRNPELAGAVYPFPLIEDGDFDIPSAYMTEEEGTRLASHTGELAALVIKAERRPSSGLNLAARKGLADRRVVVSAHMDAKDNTPGALDNAAGVIVLLLLAELLRDYAGELGIELVPFNGEDHYTAAGEIVYLKANEGKLDEILLNINIDAAGYRSKKNVYSLYECSDKLAQAIRKSFAGNEILAEGAPWYQGDHMVFAMNGTPALAVTSEGFMEIETQFAHTPKDRPELVDCGQLVEIATALWELLQNIEKKLVF
ncbi:MAG: M28 family peptidase [Anaerolineales bacterium]|nr:M28 family peptidase [Anaerolineales bacterium]